MTPCEEDEQQRGLMENYHRSARIKQLYKYYYILVFQLKFHVYIYFLYKLTVLYCTIRKTCKRV